MKEQWKQQMRQKMADYKEPAPEVSWDEIDKALAANKQQVKTVAMWPRRIAAAVVVLVTAGAGYYLLNREQQDIIEDTAETRLIEGTITQEPVIPQKEEVSDLPILAKAKYKIQQAIEEQKAEALSAISMVEDSVEQLALVVEEQSEVHEPEPQETKTQEQPRKSSLPEAHPTIYPSDFKRSASSDKRLMAKVYLSNAMLGNNSGNSYIELVPLYSGQTQMAELLQVSLNNDQDTTEEEVHQLDAHHHLPIHFGLVLRYALSDRWSIEGGLSYALLTSDIRQTSNIRQTSTTSITLLRQYDADIEQRLTYIGIPVNVSYQLWGNRRFNVYASVGGMAEKMVKGKRYVEETYPMIQERDESVSIRPLQFSVNGRLGAEFLFIDWLSLYAEPGVGYWFDNGSDVPTYYQDKPFSFNLNVGLRFTIK